MISTVIKLKKDLKAKAGQFLVLRSDGSVYAVEPETLHLVVAVGSEISEKLSQLAQQTSPLAFSRRDMVKRAKDMIASGDKTREIAAATGLSKVTIYRYRNQMARDGLLPGRRKKESGHHFYKTPEALEKAKRRGVKLVEGTRKDD